MLQSGNSVNQSNNQNPQPKTNIPNPEKQITKTINSYPQASNFNTVPINIPDTSLKDIDTTGSGNNSLTLNEGDFGPLYSYGDNMLEEWPSFDGGGVEKFRGWISKNVRGISITMKNRMAGTIIVVFMIDKNGTLTNISIEKGLNAELDEEVVKIFKLSPPWQPGKQHGHPVNVQYKFPVTFKN